MTSQIVSTKKSLVKGVFHFFTTTVILFPLTYVLNIILSRSGKEIIGEYQHLNLGITFITAFGLFFGENSIVFFLSKKDSKYNILFFLFYSIVTSLIFCIILFFTPLGNILNFGYYKIGYFIYFVFISFLVNLGAVLKSGLFSRLDISSSVKNAQIPQIFKLIFFIILFIYLKEFSNKYYQTIFFTITIIAYFISFINLITVYKKKERINLSLPELRIPKEIINYSFPIYLNNIFSYLFSQGDRWLSLFFFGINGLGGYGIASSLAQLVRFIPLRISQVLLPIFNKDLSVDNKILANRSMVLFNLLLSFPVAVILILLSKSIINYLGAEYGHTERLIVIILCNIFILSSVSNPNSVYILGKGNPKLLLYISIIGGILQFTLTFFLLRIDRNLIYIAISRAIGMLFMVTITSIFVLRDNMKLIPKPLYYSFFVSVSISYYILIKDNLSLVEYLFISLFVIFVITLIILSLDKKIIQYIKDEFYKIINRNGKAR